MRAKRGQRSCPREALISVDRATFAAVRNRLRKNPTASPDLSRLPPRRPLVARRPGMSGLRPRRGGSPVMHPAFGSDVRIVHSFRIPLRETLT